MSKLIICCRGGQAETAPNAVLHSSVGDVLEEFLQFSEELKGRAAGGGFTRSCLCV